MIDDTLTTFKEGAQSDVSPAQGVMLIDGWLQALDQDPNLDQLKHDLTTLRQHLNGADEQQLDKTIIRNLLNSLADQTEKLVQGPSAQGQWTGRLESMALILRNFGNRL